MDLFVFSKAKTYIPAAYSLREACFYTDHHNILKLYWIWSTM